MTTLKFTTEQQPTIRIETVAAHLTVEGWDESHVEITGNVRQEAVSQSGNELTISAVNSDLEVHVPTSATVIVYRVGADVEVSDIATLEVATVGANLEVDDVAQVRIDAVGGSAELDLRDGSATIGRVSGDLEVSGASQLTVGNVGGDADLQTKVLRGLRHVGGDLELEWSGQCEGEISARVGGDAELNLKGDGNFNLNATARGEIEGSGHEWEIEAERSTLTATFGTGEASFTLMVNGDLEISGGRATNVKADRVVSQNQADMWGFGNEMRSFAREMEAMGRELARELANLGREVAREVRREARENREHRGPGRPRVHVRVNDKEFNFDPEQIERIKREAQAAAANGIARAQEAVMRAFSNMNIPVPPAPPTPGAGPVPPVPGAGPVPPVPPSAYTGQTVRIERETVAPMPPTPPAPAAASTPPAPPATVAAPAPATSASQPDEERLAILRMVAAGQIAPDEAEAMLRSLERSA